MEKKGVGWTAKRPSQALSKDTIQQQKEKERL